MKDEIKNRKKKILTFEIPCEILCISALPLITTGAFGVGLSFSDIPTVEAIFMIYFYFLLCCGMNLAAVMSAQNCFERTFGLNPRERERLQSELNSLESNKPKFLMFFNKESISNKEANPSFNHEESQAVTFDSKEP
ncbi:hypothetical protein [Legionella waltersii]|nr:hypothetical protein [Legionella waltersii]